MATKRTKTPAVSVTSDRLGGDTGRPFGRPGAPVPPLSSTDDGEKLGEELPAGASSQRTTAEGGLTATEESVRDGSDSEEEKQEAPTATRLMNALLERLDSLEEYRRKCRSLGGDDRRAMKEIIAYLSGGIYLLHEKAGVDGRSRRRAEKRKAWEDSRRVLRLQGEILRLQQYCKGEEEERRRAEAGLDASRRTVLGLRGELEGCRLELERLRAGHVDEGGGVDAAARARTGPVGDGGGDASPVGAGAARGAGVPVFRFSGSSGRPAAPGGGTLPRQGEGRGWVVPAGWGSSFGGARSAGGGGGIPPAGDGEPDAGLWQVARGARGRRRRRRRARAAASGGAAPPAGGVLGPLAAPSLLGGRAGPRAAVGRTLPPPPLTAAVTIRLDGKEGLSYAEALRRARERIPLAELGIVGASVRRAACGAILVEVPGPGGGDKADALAGRLRAVLPEAKIARPSRFGEVRLVGFDESVLPEEVRLALSSCAGCGAGEVRLGALRWGSRGVGSVWARLPLAAAQAAAGAGRVALGWSVARIELLGDRPLQCHKCWGFGHMRASCSGTDRSGACYRCGRTGHIARDCAESASCAVCREQGRDAAHRLGGSQCAASREDAAVRARRRRRRRGRPPADPLGGGHSGPLPVARGGG